MEYTNFFEGLSTVGWMGIGIWILFAIILAVKTEWFKDYEKRFPKVNAFDEYLYDDWHYYVFMIVRFLVIIIVITVITRIMFRL